MKTWVVELGPGPPSHPNSFCVPGSARVSPTVKLQKQEPDLHKSSPQSTFAVSELVALLDHQASYFLSVGRVLQAARESGIERLRILMSDVRKVCVAETVPTQHFLNGR